MHKLGFGVLRLQKTDPNDERSIDLVKAAALFDAFLERGGTYFDTAYTYNGGASETTLREALVRRYPREAFFLTDKLPTWMVKTREDCWRYFNEQLERCGVTWFDGYLLHWLSEAHYEICKQYDGFGFLQQLQDEGKVRHIGFSFHDKAEVLDRILTENPCVEYVQLQLNYLDWESPAIESRKCYETAVRHGKKVLVMEPVKGGTLAVLPPKAEEVLRRIHPEESPASWAIRFAESCEGVAVVLSGMNSMEQVLENMREQPLLNEEERAALERVCEIIRENPAVPCTGCHYCVSHAHCPKNICIPEYFGLYNEHVRTMGEDDWKIAPAFAALKKEYGSPADCIGCRQCVQNCPQQIDIPAFLEKIK